MITVRPAQPDDAATMADLLNAIIAQGGTTAMTEPVTGVTLLDWQANAADKSAWHVAQDDSGLLGFQWIAPHPDLPAEAADIATFTRLGETGKGIGSLLFAATQQAARRLGYRWINANIRADNSGGLRYYESRGFQDYGRKAGVVLASGLIVDKVLKRYNL